MIDDMMKLVDRFVGIFKKRIYGKTFYCPVCHLELSEHDTDENGLLVCPLCSVVIELYETYGHFVPVVNDVEINRYQPKARFHPMATHLPIGLFPLAVFGACVLLFMSIVRFFAGTTALTSSFFSGMSSTIDNVIFIFLFIAVVSSTLTFFSGFFDWKKRYGGRAYRIITLKIILSAVFLVVGLATVLMHVLVFNAGFLGFDSIFELIGIIVYFVLLGAGMFILATLGHVGGYLVFGK